MDNYKISTQLNAALNATETELNNSPELRTGFEPQSRKWELIVRYTGDLFSLAEKFPTIEITQLLFNYAVIKIAESEIDAFSASDEIIFIEKPKRLFFEVNSGKRASCINPVQSSAISLSGHDTIVAVIDSGIDYMHPDFIDENGKTRILLLWDQSLG